MISNIEQIELRMLAEYEREGTLDIAEWTTRYPDLRDEILEYWVWLRGTPHLTDIEAGPAPEVKDGAGEEAMKQATIAVALGRVWLQEPVDEKEIEEKAIGTELQRLRGERFEQQGKAPRAFRRAAVYAWVVFVWQAKGRRVSRLAAQKATYFLEQGLDLQLFTEHRRKQFGPYDYTARYKDAEPIAEKQAWLQISGTILHPGENIASVVKHARWYVRQQGLAERLLHVLATLSESELETWATVHAAAQALQRSEKELTAESIRAFLASMPEWRNKLSRSNFVNAEIQRALIHLARLRLVRL